MGASNYNSTKLCFVYFEFYRGKDPGKRNAWTILYAVLPVAASLQTRHFVMRNQTNRKIKMSLFPVWQIHPVESRSSVAVGSKKMVRYGRPAGKQAALSPKTREKAVADQDNVGWPFGMLREYSLLGMNAIDQRRPTDQHQEERNGIPFL